jgi:hypothetical protein
MRETMAAMLRGVSHAASPKPKRIANNTIQYVNEAGDTVIRLHHTDIVVKHLDGTYTLNSGGWRTSTTKERLNTYSPARIYQDKGEWFLSVREIAGADLCKPRFTRYVYADGMRVDATGCPVGYDPDKLAKEVTARKALARSINKFVKLVDTVPKARLMPSTGDCWLCMMFDRLKPEDMHNPNAGWNCNNADTAPGGNTDHLLEHIKEGYVHGSLLFNALQWAGYRDPMLLLHMGHRDLLKRALRRYLRRRLGLG